MNSNSRRILDLLAQGKITAEQAEQLLNALGVNPEPSKVSGSGPSSSQSAPPPPPRFFRISVTESNDDGRPAEKVNVRVPFTILRGGVKLGALMPGFLGERVAARMRERGIDLDFSKLDQKQIDSILADIGEMSVDVDGGRSKVRISCE